MIKKINIFLVLLLLLISVGAVSAVDDGNATDIVSSEAIQDTIEVSVDEDISYCSEDLSEVVSIDEDSAKISASEHTVTDDNYAEYFSIIDGKLVSSKVSSGDTIKLDGSFSNKKFIFNMPVKIIGTSTNKMSNVMITLSSGASGSSITGLNILNTKAETYGIFLNSANDCSVSYCNINNTGKSSYCICVANGAAYNNVTDNNLKAYGETYGHGSRSTSPLLLSGSHNNYIANNRVESDDANGIYLSGYSGGPLNGGDSNYNVIFNNTVHYNVLPTSWAYGVQVMGNHNKIRNNTVIGGYRGISTAGTGNVITGNRIINVTGADYNHPGVESGGEYGIVASYNSIVANNTVIGAKIISTGAGITAIDNSTVENNWVNVTLKGRGIVAGGSNVVIKNNVIFTESGSGVYEKDEGSGLLVEGNNITSDSGVGILIEKLSSKRMPKDVKIISNTIITNNKYAIDAAGVQADTSVIEDNIIEKGKLINSPAGVIDTSKPTYIYKGKTHTITPENIRDYINDNGGLTSEISDNDILNFEGTFSNEVIYITKAVKITGKNPKFYNSTFKVTCGNVLIENLTIINNEAERVNAWGIFVNQASGVRIQNNNIRVTDPKASYAIYVLQSSDVDVWNNVLYSEGDYLTFTLLAYACEDCNFSNNVIHTVGTGESYKFSPEKCIDGNELVINGRSYCLDGNELVIDGTRYSLNGTELKIDGRSYCLDGNELVIDGTSYCLDGDEFSIDGTTYCIDGNEFVVDGKSYCLDGNEFSVDGTTYCIDGNELSIDGTTYCLDGNELTIDGKTYCLDGNELTIDGTTYCLDGNELSIDGKTYCLDGNELTIDGTAYCLDGNELVIDGKTYCIDGGELVIDGKSYCVDGNEYCMDGAHVVSEIYQTYGILLLYSSNNIVSGNDVNVTSKLSQQQSTTGNKSSQNSIVGIDLYFNSHNNTFSKNNVYVKSMDNYIYGMGVLGYYTGHNAPEGQGATNNSFIENQITLDGVYCVEGIIIGDESEDTIVEGNVIDLKSDAVVYGIYFEMSHKSYVSKNTLTLDSQAVYGIEGYGSNSNTVLNNSVNADGKAVYGILFLNGKDNYVSGNKINANGNGDDITVRILDSIVAGNAGLYLMANSTDNYIGNNEIASTKGYAVLLDDAAINNVIENNLLDSEKGIGNKAVSNQKNNEVSENYKYVIAPIKTNIKVPYLGTGEFILNLNKDLDGAIITFYDAKNNEFAKSTVSNGVASAKYDFDASYKPATYGFYATFSKEDYKSTEFSLSVTVEKGNIVIDLNEPSIRQGSTGKVVATVLDELGNAIVGANVEFNRINSAGRETIMGNAVSDENGIATLSYPVPLTLSDESHQITAKVTGVKNYNDANATSKMTVLKKVSITGGKSSSVYYGSAVTYKVRVLDSDKKPVAGQVVTFKVNGKTKNVKTNNKGYASYSVKLKAGTYTITATCNGVKVSHKITFKPTVIAKNLNKKKAKKITYTAKLVNNKGKILKNKKITFKLKGKKYVAKTNKKGIATITLKNLKVGKYTITATYGGCTVKKTIKIKK